MYEYIGKMVNVVDADTFDIEVDLGFTVVVKQRFRLLGGDAYETRLGRGTTPEEKEKGLKAKAYVERLCIGYGEDVRIISNKTGKYGRYLCDVYFRDLDGEYKLNLLGMLKEEGYLKTIEGEEV